jgi:predicted ribosome quality control (RQC) complex YloA/Tae2 family protein
MLLRKHLGGAKLLRVTQEGYERVARLTFSGYDEMGYSQEKHLVVEIMGKYSNLLLLDGKDKILAVLHAVDFSSSRVRQLLPGMTYELPPKQDKFSPLEETKEGFCARFETADGTTPCDKWIIATYLGTSSQVARELAWLASGATDTPLYQVDKEALWQVFSNWFEHLQQNQYVPSLMSDAEVTPLDFCYAPLSYFGASTRVTTFGTVGELLDACYGAKEKRDRMRRRATDLWGIVERSESRIRKKLALQEEELVEAEQGEKWQRMGDLLTANLWRLKRGDASLVTEDFYQDPPCEVEIPLDSRLSPAANAQRYYKWYTKAKHAKENLTIQMDKSRGELLYLESVRTFLESAETEADLTEIREELYRAGYASRMKGYASPKQIKLRPMEFVSPSGYRVLVGRNNMQNDQLTFHTASKGDLWFHVKELPGSHVILFCAGEEPPAEDYTFAARLAAKHSAAKGSMVAVDYTRVRYVKKPPAAKPGYVTYSTNYTAYVSAEEEG